MQVQQLDLLPINIKKSSQASFKCKSEVSWWAGELYLPACLSNGGMKDCAQSSEAELLIHSVRAEHQPSSASSFLLPPSFCRGMRMLRRSDSALPLSSSLVCLLSLFSHPYHHSLMLVAGSLLSPSRLPRSHSLVISLTPHALSTIQLPTKTHTHRPNAHKPAAADNVSLDFLLPSSSTDSEITSNAVIVLMSSTQRYKKHDLAFLDPCCQNHSY